MGFADFEIWLILSYWSKFEKEWIKKINLSGNSYLLIKPTKLIIKY